MVFKQGYIRIPSVLCNVLHLSHTPAIRRSAMLAYKLHLVLNELVALIG